MRCNQNKISEVLKFMQVCIDTLKEYGLIVEKDGKLFLEISEAEKTKRKGQRKEKEAIYNIINNIKETLIN